MEKPPDSPEGMSFLVIIYKSITIGLGSIILFGLMMGWIKNYSYEESDSLLRNLASHKNFTDNFYVGIIDEKEINVVKQKYSFSLFASGAFDLLYDCKDILIRVYDFRDYNVEVNDIALEEFLKFKIIFTGCAVLR